MGVAVLREGFETAVFLTTQEQATGFMGAIAGAVGAVLIGWLLFSLGVKLNLQRFFQIMGGLLILIVAGLVLSVCKSLDTLTLMLEDLPHWQHQLCFFTPTPHSSCLWGPLVWNGASILPEREFPGLVFKTFLGYRDHIYGLQGVAYLVFLIGLSKLYLQRLNPRQTETQSPSTITPKKLAEGNRAPDSVPKS